VDWIVELFLKEPLLAALGTGAVTTVIVLLLVLDLYRAYDGKFSLVFGIVRLVARPLARCIEWDWAARRYRRALSRYQDFREAAEDLVPLEAFRQRSTKGRERAFLARLRRQNIEEGRYGPRPEEEAVDLLGAVTSERHVVLTGEPGVGKTTSLRYLAFLLSDKQARRRFRNPYLNRQQRHMLKNALGNRLPLFARLQQWALHEGGQSVLSFLLDES